MPGDRLPRDYRTVVAVAGATLAAYFAVRTWVITIAEAQDAPQRAALERMQPMVRELVVACVKRGECDPKVLVEPPK